PHAGGLDRDQLQREQPPCGDREGKLCGERRWLSDAGAQGPGPAGLALFRRGGEVRTDSGATAAADRCMVVLGLEPALSDCSKSSPAAPVMCIEAWYCF